MKLNLCRTLALAAACALALPAGPLHAQGVTTGGVTGVITDAQGLPVPGASVVAVHEPSGTRYETTSRADGGYSMPGMRVGGPYTVTVTLSGFQPQATKEVFLTLGASKDVDVTLRTASLTEEVTVTAEANPVFSSERTGASTAVSREKLATLPNVSDRLDNFTRLTPQYSGGPFGGAFMGNDNRANNITVDGSYFNNSFGLAGSPGERTGVAPISMSAVEAVQVNIAPYDVRQGNFIGAGVNTVTRSGTNNFRGSAYYWFRDNSLVGTKAKDLDFNPGTFDFSKLGAWVSGPILRNKLFFFVSGEDEKLTQPGTTFRANTGSETVGGSITRVRAADLDQLSSFLRTNFDYETGPYQDYSHETPATRLLAKLDYNLSDRHKLTLRYVHLDSKTDVLLSNSSSLGFGTRRTSTTGLNFQNSNYQILENIRSVIGEWNSVLGTNTTNSFQAGYTHQDESRDSRGDFFPFVDILDGSTVYTSFGFEPFTPNNELRYGTFQAQDNFTHHRGAHAFTFGASAQRYRSENVFFSGAQSVYTYNSLADFYADANDYLANPNRTTSPITLRRFQVRWMNIPGLDKPTQPLEVWYTGLYAQDEWKLSRDFKVIAGIRGDVAKFGDTGFDNADADRLTFRDEDGSPVQFQTAKLPNASILWSPRVGFNWDVNGNRRTQVRGGSGVFTGPPPYVWISNQIGTTGVLTGFEELNNTTARPFNPNPDRYKPQTVTGAPASSYELAVTDPGFKFPQVWRTNFAVDQKLAWGIIGTGEFIYNRDLNGVYYINANLAAPNAAFSGVDARPRWTASNRIVANVANTTVLKNQNIGRSWNVAGSLEKTFRAGFLKAAYSYGRAKNTIDPSSVAFGSWSSNQHAGDPNNPGLGFAAGSPGHRALLAGAYRLEFLKFGATTLSFVSEAITAGNVSFTYSGDLNGDGGTSNDLLYIPRDVSEMNFQEFVVGTRTFTAAQQAAAWDTYINNDRYLREHRGQYAERNAAFLPLVYRTDVSIAQDLFRSISGRRNELQFRADILNFFNLLNSDWGVGQRYVAGSATNTQPLIVPTAAQGGAADAQGRAQYRLRVVNNELQTTPLEQTAGISDVWRVQFSLRYTFI
jgi:hypothetical protein